MIRDRAAKFYRDHTTGCNVFAAGVLTGVLVATKRAEKRFEITSADILTSDVDGVKVLSIMRKNGSTRLMTYNPNV